jgi:hypothetical protein
VAQSAILAIRIVGNSRSAVQAIGGVQKSLARLQSSLKATAKAMLVGSAAKALVAALAPIAAAAAAGGLALGALGVAAAGQIKAMTDVASAATKYADAQQDAATKKAVADRLAAQGSSLAGKAASAYQSSLLKVATTQQAWVDSSKGIPAATAASALAFAQLKTAYTAWSNALAPTVMPLFTQSLNIARGALSGLTPLVVAAAKAIKPFLDRVQKAVQSGAFAAWAKDMAAIGGPVLKSVLQAVGNIGSAFAKLLVKLGPSSKGVGKLLADLTAKFKAWSANGGGDSFAKLSSQAVPALASLATAVVKVATAFSPFAGIILPLVTILGQFVSVLPTAAIQAMVPVILALVAAWRIMATVSTIARLALVATTLALALNTAATEGNTIATRAMAIATNTAAIAQRVLNLAMRANLIGIIVTALILLVGAIVLAYKKSDTFRALLNSLWGVIKSVAAFIAGQFVTAWKALTTAVRAVIKFVSSVISWLRRVVVPVALAPMRLAFAAISTAVSTVIKFVKSVIGWLAKVALPGALKAIKDAFNKAADAASWLIEKVKQVISWLKKIPGGGLLSKAIDAVTRAAPDVSVQRALAATRATSDVVRRGAPQLAVSPQIFVSIDGQQLQGRITRTVNNQMRSDGARLQAGGWA